MKAGRRSTVDGARRETSTQRLRCIGEAYTSHLTRKVASALKNRIEHRKIAIDRCRLDLQRAIESRRGDAGGDEVMAASALISIDLSPIGPLLMKKSLLILWILAAGLLAAPAFAASLSLTRSSSNGSYQIYFNGESAVFDTFSFSMKATSGSFTRFDFGFDTFLLMGPGWDFTYISDYLSAQPAQGGMGLTIIGQQVTATTLAFDATKLGGKIDTSGQPGGRLFLANFILNEPAACVAEVKLIREGEEIDSATFAFVPEPAAASLLAVGLLMLRLGRLSKQTRSD